MAGGSGREKGRLVQEALVLRRLGPGTGAAWLQGSHPTVLGRRGLSEKHFLKLRLQEERWPSSTSFLEYEPFPRVVKLLEYIADWSFIPFLVSQSSCSHHVFADVSEGTRKKKLLYKLATLSFSLFSEHERFKHKVSRLHGLIRCFM